MEAAVPHWPDYIDDVVALSQCDQIWHNFKSSAIFEVGKILNLHWQFFVLFGKFLLLQMAKYWTDLNQPSDLTAVSGSWQNWQIFYRWILTRNGRQDSQRRVANQKQQPNLNQNFHFQSSKTFCFDSKTEKQRTQRCFLFQKPVLEFYCAFLNHKRGSFDCLPAWLNRSVLRNAAATLARSLEMTNFLLAWNAAASPNKWTCTRCPFQRWAKEQSEEIGHNSKWPSYT